MDINLRESVIDEVFMYSVLVQIVVLSVASVTEAGITALIENSPKLCLFRIHFYQEFFNYNNKQLKSFKDILKMRLVHRKLFNLDGLSI